MSLGRKLIDLLMAGRTRRKGAMSSHTVILKHSSTKIVTSEAGEGMLDDAMLSEMASALGLDEAALRQMIEQGNDAQSIADLLQKQTSASSVEVLRTASPALRVECHDCHRTVARGNGYCVYCGAYLPLEENATSSTKSVQQQVDEQFAKETGTAQPQKSMSEEEQQAFLRRISHM
jgi:hypothetical protein